MQNYAPAISNKHYPYDPKFLSQSDALTLLSEYRGTGNVQYRNDIVMGYMQMIRAFCTKFSIASGIPVEELLQEAVIGFTAGLEKYVYPSGSKISTYALRSAQYALLEYQKNHGGTIKVSRHSHKLIKSTKSRIKAFNAEYHCDVAPDAIIDDYEPADRAGVLLLLTSSFVGTDKFQATRKTFTPTIELGVWMDSEYIGDEIPDTTESDPSPEPHVDHVRDAIHQLPEPNKSILLAFYSMSAKEFTKQCAGWNISEGDALGIVHESLKTVRTAVGL